MKKIFLLSLGCPRNILDSEVLLGLLEKKDMSIVEAPEDSDIAIVNTCGFIQDAKEESINAILQLADLKKAGTIQKIIVTGCLSQRYPDDLMKEIAEIDGMFGSSDFTKIPDYIDKMFAGEKIREVSSTPDFLYDHKFDRKILTEKHYAYVKIQEGCSNRCTYCVIPDLKGPRRSRTIDSVVEEVKQLRKEYGIKEALIIGQDITSFGLDRSGSSELVDLIKKVSPVMQEDWVRLLYTHPAHFSDELIDVVANTNNVCKYIDLPIQHINNRILKAMNRMVTKEQIVDLVAKIRKGIPDVVLRTSIIVGFPGETEEEFEELMDFLEKARFERLGAFIYSQEEGTPAGEMDGQVPQKVKEARFDAVMKLQQKISNEDNLKYFGETLKAIIDEKVEGEEGHYIGRSQMDAPEVDGVIFIEGEGLEPGDFVDVRITGTMEYDLVGEVG